jgi:hypothetical protein
VVWERSKRKRKGKKEKKKRRRSMKEKREKMGETEEWKREREKRKEKIEKREKVALSEFWVERVKWEDMWEAVEKKKTKVRVEWIRGMVDVTRWEKIWGEREIVIAKYEWKEIDTWKGVRKEMKRRKAGIMDIEMKMAKNTNKRVKKVIEMDRRRWEGIEK